jgi:DNA mismatch repair protein MutL
MIPLNGRIKPLPDHLVDQIKAGEVIERPAALLKELIENSLDASSTEISVQIAGNGLDLIAVEDNGTGILFDDLPLAFSRHATSKIVRFEDIYSLVSFGFRGEALASIASVGRVNCTSIPASGDQGGVIVVHGGEIQSLTPRQGGPQGTSLFVRHLFFNTPARLKFARSATSEKNSLKKILNAFLLSAPNVAFHIKWDDKDKASWPALPASRDTLIARMLKIIQSKDPSTLKEANATYDGHHVRLFLSTDSGQTQSRHQYIFVNNRQVEDKKIHHTILQSFRAVWPQGESGHYFIFIDVPADQLDVNVHPSKTQVKFAKMSVVFSLVANVTESLRSRPSLISGATHLTHPHDFTQETSHGENPDRFPQTSRLVLLSKRYSLFLTDDGRCFLADVPGILGRILRKGLSKPEILPLLISEPFPRTQELETLLSSLRENGFEFDALNANTFALRSIPSFMGSWNYKKFLQLFIESLASCTPDSLDCAIDRLISLQDNSISSLVPQNQLLHLLKENLDSSLQEKNLIPLGHDEAATLFKERAR